MTNVFEELTAFAISYKTIIPHSDFKNLISTLEHHNI